ncbi:Flavohemoprotein [Penicillium subrubescens]|uniref:Flavohemoprotein n=1 Tax=Penicillium subrubescens TaxID=1316194 RepID=UPI002544F283|nr:Flavohemoprotein [Penicillium subrubescens]KAJ5892193.1 Flavohemoprotein [Penicillium subrubescens]
MMSMLKSIVDQQGQARKVVFIHAARNGHVHAMKEDLAKIVAENPSVSKAVSYEDATAQDKKGVDYDHPFMKAQSKSLESLGVSPDRIHMEVSGSPSD